MSGEIERWTGEVVARVAHMPVRPGVMVTLVDEFGQRISEWVPLAHKGTHLFAEWSPGVDGFAHAFVAYDPTSNWIAAGRLDIAVRVRPENSPVELRIEAFYDTPSVPLFALAREARALTR